jgi:hypothetical protein
MKMVVVTKQEAPEDQNEAVNNENSGARELIDMKTVRLKFAGKFEFLFEICQ